MPENWFDVIIKSNYSDEEIARARLREVRAYAQEQAGGDPGKYEQAFKRAVQLLRKGSNEHHNP
jgi:hypothetical protein